MNSTDIKIFSGSENIELTSNICSTLNIPVGDIYHHKFASGETYCQFKENIRGKDVFLVSCRGVNTNDSLMELLVMSDAAKRASAGRITAVLPLFYYARQDRKDKSRVPITAKLVLDIIAASGINRVLTMDLHSPQVGGFTNLPFDHLTFEPILLEYINNKYKSIDDRKSLMLMAPDVGAVKRVETYASLLKCDFGFISKKRIGDETVELQRISGNVIDKNVIIIDDVTESCGTLVQAATACKQNGAKHVICAVTHGCFTESAMYRLTRSMRNPNNTTPPIIDQFIHSNTVKHLWTMLYKPDDIITLDVSVLLAKAINNIHNNESVSQLFTQ